MRAVLLAAPGRVDVVDDWPEPEPGPSEVVVAMRGVGLCGSDLSVYDGTRAVPSFPWVMGHEGGGEIVAVGPEVSGREVGQRVVIEPNYCCFGCAGCHSGRTSTCTRRQIVGINSPGLLAERVAVPARFTWPVPPSVDDGALACIEPLAVAQAAVRRWGVRAGDRCLVVGAGSQGLFLCQSLLAIGARTHVVEPHEGRLALAERLGGKPADLRGERDYPFVFDAAGAPMAWDTAMSAVGRGGTVVVIGMTSHAVALSTRDLVQRQLTLRGALIYDHPNDFRDTVAAVTAGQLSPTEVLREGIPPQDAALAFAQARELAGKSWITLSAWRD